jgi:hypothetical protein
MVPLPCELLSETAGSLWCVLHVLLTAHTLDLGLLCEPQINGYIYLLGRLENPRSDVLLPQCIKHAYKRFLVDDTVIM